MSETSIEHASEGPDASPEQKRRPRLARRTLIISAASLLTIVLLYFLALWLLADRVPRGTEVAGVQIGGQTAKAAATSLADGLLETTEEPVSVQAEEVEGEFEPSEAGLVFDAKATVSKVTGFTASPVRLWQHIAGGPKLEPVSDVDVDVLRTTLGGMADTFAVPPVDGNIVFEETKPVAVPAEDGFELDLDAAVEEVANGWITGPRPLPLPTQVVAPSVSNEEVDRAMEEDAKPLVAAPVKVVVDDETGELSESTLASSAEFEVAGESLLLVLDGEELVEELRPQIPELETAPVDATVELTEAGPEVKPHVLGAQVDTDVLTRRVLDAIGEPERTAEVVYEDVEAEWTTEDMEALQIKEPISEFATNLTADAIRTENIRTGAASVSGTILKPGETFSLLDTLGPIDADHGYGNAGVIVEGQIVDGMGGGLSQLATTLYNASFFAGLEDVEHRPHSQYIPRYPEGREATIANPSLDLKFKNDTDYGVLLEVWVADGQVHARFWGTKVWEIEAQKSGRSGIVKPTTVTSNRAGCQRAAPGEPGFLVTVDRLFYQNGELVKTESNSWRYQPANGVKCKSD